MIDLTTKGLPNTVTVGGKPYSIYVDFRLWLKFMISISKLKQGETIDVAYLFVNDMPMACTVEDLLQFASPKSELPRQLDHSNIKTIDYELDADYIYSAFLGQYGIDLTEVDNLHWHKFLALLRGVNEATELRHIMGYRCYKKNTDKNIDQYERLKWAWAIDNDYETEIDDAELKEFSDLFTEIDNDKE